MTRLFRALSASAQAFLLPQPCALCARPVADPRWVPICGRCLCELLPWQGPCCPYCGGEVATDVLSEGYPCSRCRSGKFSLDRARAWGRYQDELRLLIHRFKFGGMKRLAIPLADLLTEAFRLHFGQSEIDLIVPVPMHPKRRRQRGFDQTRLLAGRLSRACGRPYLNLVARTRDTRPQFGLDRVQRRRNLRGAFALHLPDGGLSGLRVLIVDDVMTSGATVEFVGKLLRDSGRADYVAALVIARA